MRFLVALAIMATPAAGQPLEGRWAEDVKTCGTSYREYTKAAVRTVFPKPTRDEVCALKSVKPKGSALVVQMTCKDDSGDGPSKFTVTENIDLQGDTMKRTSSVFKGEVFTMVRCP
jgi:hypothetical protein